MLKNSLLGLGYDYIICKKNYALLSGFLRRAIVFDKGTTTYFTALYTLDIVPLF